MMLVLLKSHPESVIPVGLNSADIILLAFCIVLSLSSKVVAVLSFLCFANDYLLINREYKSGTYIRHVRGGAFKKFCKSICYTEKLFKIIHQ